MSRIDAARLKEEASRLPLRAAQDRYLSAGGRMAGGRYAEAEPLLREATRREARFPVSRSGGCVPLSMLTS